MTDDECARLSLNSDAHFSPPLFFYLTIFPHGLTICVGFEYQSHMHFSAFDVLILFYTKLFICFLEFNLFPSYKNIFDITVIQYLNESRNLWYHRLSILVSFLSVCSSVSTSVTLLYILQYYILQSRNPSPYYHKLLLLGCVCGGEGGWLSSYILTKSSSAMSP